MSDASPIRTAHRRRTGGPPPRHPGRPRPRPRRHRPAPPGEEPRSASPPSPAAPTSPGHSSTTTPTPRTAVAAAIGRDAGQRRARLLAEPDDAHEATWRERALNAEDALKAAHAEILTQRTRIGELLGQIRDLEAEWTEEAIQRITTENTTLKQRVRQLTTDNRTLDERLKAARSNLRFQDRRIADLEAQLTESASPHPGLNRQSQASTSSFE